MHGILREAALWLLGWLEKSLDPELRKRVEGYLDQARRLTAANAAAKKDLINLEGEFLRLKHRRDELHNNSALIEMQIEQLEQEVSR